MGKFGLHWKQMRQEDYNIIKGFLNAKIPHGRIQKATGRGYSTIRYIEKSKNMEEYKKLVQSTYTYKKQTHKESVHTNPAKGSDMKYTTDMEILVNALSRIEQAINKLTDAWERKPDKKGIFG